MIREKSWGKGFETHLQNVHAKGYMGTDDNMPDAYESWVEGLSDEELLKMYGDMAEADLIDLQEAEAREGNFKN